MKNRRRKIWIDPLQTKLFLRISTYSLLLLIALGATASLSNHFFQFYQRLTGSGWNGFLLSPTAAMFMLLGVLFVYDMLRFTHRFAGPIYRFRTTIRAITQGEAVQPIQLRKGDMLVEMQDEINEMLEALQQRGLLHTPSTEILEDEQVAQPVG